MEDLLTKACESCSRKKEKCWRRFKFINRCSNYCGPDASKHFPLAWGRPNDYTHKPKVKLKRGKRNNEQPKGGSILQEQFEIFGDPGGIDEEAPDRMEGISE